jgi:hypothetical protein
MRSHLSDEGLVPAPALGYPQRLVRVGPEPGEFRPILGTGFGEAHRELGETQGQVLGQEASLLARVHASREGEYVNQFR